LAGDVVPTERRINGIRNIGADFQKGYVKLNKKRLEKANAPFTHKKMMGHLLKQKMPETTASMTV